MVDVAVIAIVAAIAGWVYAQMALFIGTFPPTLLAMVLFVTVLLIVASVVPPTVRSALAAASGFVVGFVVPYETTLETARQLCSVRPGCTPALSPLQEALWAVGLLAIPVMIFFLGRVRARREGGEPALERRGS
jgi:hypothetical protein